MWCVEIGERLILTWTVAFKTDIALIAGVEYDDAGSINKFSYSFVMMLLLCVSIKLNEMHYAYFILLENMNEAHKKLVMKKMHVLTWHDDLMINSMKGIRCFNLLLIR